MTDNTLPSGCSYGHLAAAVEVQKDMPVLLLPPHHLRPASMTPSASTPYASPVTLIWGMSRQPIKKKTHIIKILKLTHTNSVKLAVTTAFPPQLQAERHICLQSQFYHKMGTIFVLTLRCANNTNTSCFLLHCSLKP